MTTTHRPAARLFAALAAVAAGVAALTACTGSGASSKSGSTGATNPAATSTSGTSSSGTNGSASPGSKQSGGSGGKPLATQTIQGSHLTYNIDIWARETAKSCADHVSGAKLTALLRGTSCTLTRFIGTTKVDGKSLGLAEATLNFGGPPAKAASTATQVAVLLSSSTDDGVVDLLHDGKRLPSGPTQVPDAAPSNAVNSASSVKTVRTWYLSGTTSADDPRLSEAVEDLSTV